MMYAICGIPGRANIFHVMEQTCFEGVGRRASFSLYNVFCSIAMWISPVIRHKDKKFEQAQHLRNVGKTRLMKKNFSF
jgi:hypothetical protein